MSMVQYCFTSRTATSTFTQLLSTESHKNDTLVKLFWYKLVNYVIVCALCQYVCIEYCI